VDSGYGGEVDKNMKKTQIVAFWIKGVYKFIISMLVLYSATRAKIETRIYKHRICKIFFVFYKISKINNKEE
jgi:hypothetical protein